MLRFSVRIFSLFGVALLLASLSYAQEATSQPAASSQVMTNGDVERMVEAKLANDIKSPADFKGRALGVTGHEPITAARMDFLRIFLPP